MELAVAAAAAAAVVAGCVRWMSPRAVVAV